MLQILLTQCAQMQPPPPEVWVIGGAQLYALALPLASRVLATEIQADFEGDAHAPPLGPEWQECTREPVTSASGLRLDFVCYQRQPLPAIV